MNKKIGVLLVTVFSMGATSDATQLATSSLNDARSSLPANVKAQGYAGSADASPVALSLRAAQTIPA